MGFLIASFSGRKTANALSEGVRIDKRFGLMAPIEKSHASLAQFRTETKYASLWGERGCRILT